MMTIIFGYEPQRRTAERRSGELSIIIRHKQYKFSNF